MNINDIKVQPEWLELLSPMMELAVTDSGLIVIHGCMVGCVHLPAMEIEVLVEWTMYNHSLPRYIHEAIFKELGYHWTRPNTQCCEYQGDIYSSLKQMPDNSCSSLVYIHPGMFPGTWANAEEDFRQTMPPQGEDLEKMLQATNLISNMGDPTKHPYRPSNN